MMIVYDHRPALGLSGRSQDVQFSTRRRPIQFQFYAFTTDYIIAMLRSSLEPLYFI